MKKAILILSIVFTITSCGSKVKYLKETNASELKEPFKAKIIRIPIQNFIQFATLLVQI